MRPGIALSFAVALSACASSPPPPTTAAPSAAEAARRAQSDAEWRSALAEGTFTALELTPLGEPRRDLVGPMAPEPGSAPPGAIWRVTCAPGGLNDSFATERATGRVWRVTTIHRVTAPEGVSVPATRCEAQAVRAPEGGVAGTVVVSPP